MPRGAVAALRVAAALVLLALALLPTAPARAQAAHDQCQKVDVLAVKLRDTTVLRVRLCGPHKAAPVPAQPESQPQPQQREPQPKPQSKRRRNEAQAPQARRDARSSRTASAPETTAAPAAQPDEGRALQSSDSPAAAPIGSTGPRMAPSARGETPARNERRDRQRHESANDEQPALASPMTQLAAEPIEGGWWLSPLPLLGAALLALGGAWLVMGRRSDRLAYSAAGVAAGSSRRKTRWETLKPAVEAAAIVAVAFAAIFALESFVVRPVLIPSASMAPTLGIGNQVVMERVTQRSRAPSRGDIVVFRPPAGATQKRCGVTRTVDQACSRPTAGTADSHYIKRVVAAPGDRLQIIGGRVYIDGRRQPEPYAKTSVGCGDCNLPKDITIPTGHYFLMGDNRGSSVDSRVWGPVREDHIIGRAFFRFWPPPRIGPL